jgi:hypothetical protein
MVASVSAVERDWFCSLSAIRMYVFVASRLLPMLSEARQAISAFSEIT